MLNNPEDNLHLGGSYFLSEVYQEFMCFSWAMYRSFGVSVEWMENWILPGLEYVG